VLVISGVRPWPFLSGPPVITRAGEHEISRFSPQEVSVHAVVLWTARVRQQLAKTLLTVWPAVLMNDVGTPKLGDYAAP